MEHGPELFNKPKRSIGGGRKMKCWLPSPCPDHQKARLPTQPPFSTKIPRSLQNYGVDLMAEAHL